MISTKLQYNEIYLFWLFSGCLKQPVKLKKSLGSSPSFHSKYFQKMFLLVDQHVLIKIEKICSKMYVISCPTVHHAVTAQPAFTCSKLTIETLEQGVK